MGVLDRLRTFTRVQPRAPADGYVTVREFVDAQARLEASIASIQKALREISDDYVLTSGPADGQTITNGVTVEADDDTVAIIGNGYGDSGQGVVGTGDGASGVGVWGASEQGKGVHGVSQQGYGVVAESDTSTPTKSAMRIVPQDANPSSASKGDLYVKESDGKLRIYDGSSWVVVGTQT